MEHLINAYAYFGAATFFLSLYWLDRWLGRSKW